MSNDKENQLTQKNLLFISNPAIICAAGNNCTDYWNNITSDKPTNIIKVSTDLNENNKEYYVAATSYRPLAINEVVQPYIDKLTKECLKQITGAISAVINKYKSNKVGLCIASCDNASAISLAAHKTYFNTGDFPRDYETFKQSASYIAKWVADFCNITGPRFSFSTACSSSASALVTAAQLIKSGECDAVLCGGVDIASLTTLVGFDSLAAVARDICNPMGKNRHGITLGDGAAFFLVTKEPIYEIDCEDKANSLKNESCVTLAGYGVSCDAYHATAPDPAGSGAARAMEAALKMAALDKSDINYVNLHGTGTIAGDKSESIAMASVFGENMPPAASTKGAIGHTLGAAGAVGVVTCMLALTQKPFNNKYLLPIHRCGGVADDTIPRLNLTKIGDNVPKMYAAMSNSFGFGGANVSVILKKISTA